MKMHPLKGIFEKYGITVSMQKKLIKDGKLSVVKVGNKNFITEKEIERFIEENTIKATNV